MNYLQKHKWYIIENTLVVNNYTTLNGLNLIFHNILSNLELVKIWNVILDHVGMINHGLIFETVDNVLKVLLSPSPKFHHSSIFKKVLCYHQIPNCVRLSLWFEKNEKWNLFYPENLFLWWVFSSRPCVHWWSLSSLWKLRNSISWEN